MTYGSWLVLTVMARDHYENILEFSVFVMSQSACVYGCIALNCQGQILSDQVKLKWTSTPRIQPFMCMETITMIYVGIEV